MVAFFQRVEYIQLINKEREMTNAIISTLRTEFSKIEAIDPSSPSYKKLIALLDRCDDEAIVAAKDAGIKFVSSLALNRCIRRGLV